MHNEIADDTVEWWSKSIKNLNKRYAKNNGLELFHPKDVLLARDLKGLIFFYNEYCSSGALPPRPEKKSTRALQGFANLKAGKTKLTSISI
jgi:hypothetical protein